MGVSSINFKSTTKSSWAFLAGLTLLAVILLGTSSIVGAVEQNTPTLLLPANNAVVRGEALLSDWSDEGATEYVYQSYHDAALTNLRWEATYTESEKSATNVADSTFWWRVKAIDASANESPWSDAFKVTIDNTDPAQVIGMTIHMGLNTSATNLGCSGYTNERWITVDWADSTDANFEYYNYETRGTWSTTLTPSERTGQISDLDGEYKYRVQAVDKANNKGAFSDWCYVTLDRSAPVSNITSHSGGDYVNGTIAVNGSVTDDNPHHYYAVIRDSSNSVVAGPGTVNRADSFTDEELFQWDTTTVADGTYTIWLASRDAADNRDDSVSLAKAEVIVDNTAPAAPTGLQRLLASDHSVIVPCEAVSQILSMHPDWDDNAETDFAYYEYTSFNAPSGDIGLNEEVFYDSIFEYNGPWLPGEGTYGFAVRAVDKAGNTSDWSLTGKTLDGSCQITYDDTAPTVDAGTDEGTVTSSFVHAGAASDTGPGAITTEWVFVSGPGAVIVTDATALSTTFSADTDGTYEMMLTATDEAGNQTSDTFTFELETPQAVLGESTTTTPTPTTVVTTAASPVVVTTSSTGSTTTTINTSNTQTSTNTSAEDEDEDGEVLSEQTESEDADNNSDVLQATTGDLDTEGDDDCFKILGLCWYWWLLILIPVVYIIWIMLSEDDDKKS